MENNVLVMSLIMMAQLINVVAAYHQVAKGIGNPFYEFLTNKQRHIIVAVSVITAAILNTLAGVAAYGEFGTAWQTVGIVALAWNTVWAFAWFVFVKKYGHYFGLTAIEED